MASSDTDSSCPSSAIESFDGTFNISIEGTDSEGTLLFLEAEPKSPVSCRRQVPKPPTPPPKVCLRDSAHRGLADSCCILKKAKDIWDELFVEGYGADVHITTEDGSIIPAHYGLLRVASPVLGNFLQQSKVNNGIRYIKIPSMPYDAVFIFIRFLYSSSYDEGEMKKFALHLLVLSHSYSVPSLKRVVCEHILEQGLLDSENVIDVLQLARKCDASRLSFVCTQMIVRDFKTISSTEGWKIMRRSNPALEQELLEYVVEADTRKQEQQRKIEEKKVYLQLYEAMEALIHICKDGCRTIGPRDKVLKGGPVACNFPACKGLESLVRHFSGCRTRVPGGCVQCKRMWQLLELHSRMCNESDVCSVPLCRHFKVKVVQHSKKEEVKWRVLVSKVQAAKIALGPFSSRRSAFL
ncbi:BTB/POZ and TAZ domain-containing protein 3 [Ipomoea triloba]|uniref:BTB/POZ and TAZ domain-containing protein 3 n=1 Tax=Ipomoea triloba TaxID=35885 RepID=UPI00125D66F0|nr:BTB/POZ and TAZ domain-containing protein 3 [Ipomoea triloba]